MLKTAFEDILVGLELMRRAPLQYAFLLLVSALVWIAAEIDKAGLLLSIPLLFLLYYWLLMLPVGILMAPSEFPKLFWRFRRSPLVSSILYPIYATVWTFLLFVPIMLVIGALLTFLVGMEFRTFGQPQEMSPLAKALMWIAATGFFAAIYGKFIANRITVPIYCSITGCDIAEADLRAGPDSGHKWQRIGYVFAVCIVLAELVTLPFALFAEGSLIGLAADTLQTFMSIALPLSASAVLVFQEMDNPQSARPETTAAPNSGSTDDGDAV